MERRQRVIIALDLDAFYVAASRKRDPSLIGLPVGIKQKNILATCSYEARRFGVAKLDGVRDALIKCPQLVLVDGEDLSYFRVVSRQVFKIVTSFLKGVAVERLGMDELFCDVTDFLGEWTAGKEAAVADGSFVGNILPSPNGPKPRPGSHASTLRRASHLAQELRTLISQRVGLTCSAGIAASKVVAKMAGNAHKPNQQTVFAPLDHQAEEAVRLFLDPLPLRQINGFGSSIVRQLCEALVDPNSPSPSETIDASQLTVALARQVFDQARLVEMFGVRVGARLWQLILGHDDEPVMASPDFPAQISIEDTYRVPLHTESAVKAQILTLSTSLLRRLETELKISDGDGDEDALPELEPYEKPLDEWIDRGIQATIRDYHRVHSSQESPSEAFDWKRYPLTLRFSTSQKRWVRVSRQTRMPVEIYDTIVPRPQRALVLAASVQALFRSVVNPKEDFALRLINIAATDLVVKRPSRGIGDFLQRQQPLSFSALPPLLEQKDVNLSTPMSTTTADSQWEREREVETVTASTALRDDKDRQNGSNDGKEQIDPEVFLQLPPDVQAELAEFYGLDWSSLVPHGRTEENKDKIASAALVIEADDTKGKQRQGSTEPDLTCPICAQAMLPYLQHDHTRWPVRGLPVEAWSDHLENDDDDHEENGSDMSIAD